jgi:hypothetical protein
MGILIKSVGIKAQVEGVCPEIIMVYDGDQCKDYPENGDYQQEIFYGFNFQHMMGSGESKLAKKRLLHAGEAAYRVFLNQEY